MSKLSILPPLFGNRKKYCTESIKKVSKSKHPENIRRLFRRCLNYEDMKNYMDKYLNLDKKNQSLYNRAWRYFHKNKLEKMKLKYELEKRLKEEEIMMQKIKTMKEKFIEEGYNKEQVENEEVSKKYLPIEISEFENENQDFEEEYKKLIANFKHPKSASRTPTHTIPNYVADIFRKIPPN